MEMEEVLARHRREKKELQATIQNLKKSVPKGDRSRRNVVQQQIDELQRQLSERQCGELMQLNHSLDSKSLSIVDAALANDNVGPPKMSKAAKRREKAAAKARCLTAAVEQDIAKHASSATAIEYSKLEAELAKRGLTLYSIPSDGDCLFASIAHQLELRGLDVCLQEACKKLGLPCPTIGDVKSTIRCLRQVASAFIRNHSEDFLPFICLEGPETIELYCKKLETPGTWGGQLEIKAISMAIETPIEVLQAEGPSVKAGEEFPASPLVITYHHYAFSTGNHYNSCRPFEA